MGPAANTTQRPPHLAVRRVRGQRDRAPAERRLTERAIPAFTSGAAAAGSLPAVELRDIHRRFGRKRVLRGIDLTVAPGSTLVVVGANGAGKTTLLRIIATLLRPSSGDGAVEGLSLVEDGDRIRARTAYVSARGFVYDDLTAVENLRFAARMAGERPSDERVEELLAAAGLAHASSQTVRTFSTGMRRRLALVGLRLRPLGLALIDEPYAGLDEEGIALVDRLVADLVAGGTTVIVASHQSGEATRRATRTVRLDDGRLLDARPPEAAH